VTLENRQRIIIDDAPLREDYVPPDLTGRERQSRLLGACLEPIRSGRRPAHAWLHGSPGTGKTAAAMSFLARFQKETTALFVVVNCYERDTLYEVLDYIITELKIFRAEEHRTSVKMERLQHYLGGRCLLILLDEIDKVTPCERARVLYTLDALGNTGLVCISASLGALFEMEERTRSRINPRTISFEPYGAEEILQILTRRAGQAFASGVCPAFLLRRIAAVCNGDARIALQALRNAAESAERSGHTSITAADLSGSWNNNGNVKKEQTLAGLTEDHRMLYQGVRDARETLCTALWETYLQRCSQANRNPIAGRTFSAYVNQLVRLGLLTCERARVKGNVRLLRLSE